VFAVTAVTAWGLTLLSESEKPVTVNKSPTLNKTFKSPPAWLAVIVNTPVDCTTVAAVPVISSPNTLSAVTPSPVS